MRLFSKVVAPGGLHFCPGRRLWLCSLGLESPVWLLALLRATLTLLLVLGLVVPRPGLAHWGLLTEYHEVLL